MFSFPMSYLVAVRLCLTQYVFYVDLRAKKKSSSCLCLCCLAETLIKSDKQAAEEL